MNKFLNFIKGKSSTKTYGRFFLGLIIGCFVLQVLFELISKDIAQRIFLITSLIYLISVPSFVVVVGEKFYEKAKIFLKRRFRE